MRKFRFVGTEYDRLYYLGNNPEREHIYNESDKIGWVGSTTVGVWAEEYPNEWKEITDNILYETEKGMKTKIEIIGDEIKMILTPNHEFEQELLNSIRDNYSLSTITNSGDNHLSNDKVLEIRFTKK